LRPEFGVEIRDVDLSGKLDDSTFAELEQLFNAESLLLFSNQRFAYEKGCAFVYRFGPSIEGIKVVTNEAATGRGQLQFHSERSFQREEPLRGLALYAREVPATGGATLFVNCSLAYRELPADLREELLGADTVHRFDPRIRLGNAYGSPGTPEGGWHFDHLRDPAFLYRHEWRTGDLVLWDNFTLIHAREPYDESRTRVLWKYEFGLPADPSTRG
jgi:taurine dioxygenase